MPVNTILQVRRGAAASWTSTNPTLSAGEIGHETDTGRLKIGDGTTVWTSLDYNAVVPTGFIAGSGLSVNVAADGSTVTYSLSDPTIQASDVTDFSEAVDDRVGSLLVAGSGVSLIYNDGSNTLTVNSALTAGSGIAVSENNGIYTVSLSDPTIQVADITDLTASAAEINLVDGSVANTVVNSKAVIYGSSGEVAASSVTTTGNVTVGGDLIVNGATTTVNSTTVTVDDPIFTLGGDTAPASDDNKDRGIEFRYHSGSAKVGFFGYDDSTGKFTFIPEATNTSEVFSGTKGEIDANVDFANILNKPDPVITVTLSGDVTGTANTTLTDLASGTVTVSTTIAANSVALGTDTTGNYVASVAVSGVGLSVTGTGEDASVVITSDATSANTNSTIVARDGSGNFSAGTITATNFSGGGSSLTSLNASNLSSGTVASGLLPNITVGSTATGPTGSFVSSVSTDAKGRVTSVNTTTHTLATTSTQGIASFNSGDFSVAAGAVTIKASGVGNSQLENDRVTIGVTPLILGTTVSAISGVSAANPVVLTFFAIDGGTP